MILVTGAAGFVGSALCVHLARRGIAVRAALRTARASDASQETVVIPDIGPDTDWRTPLAGVDCVVHLAGRVHVMGAAGPDHLAQLERVNVEGTRRLAEQAAAAGVRRFVYLSSGKVNGESSPRPFTEADAPQPKDAYASSKWEAEQALMEVAAAAAGMEWVVLRPPLVYGPGVRANFLSLMRAVVRGFPLPLGAIENRRSLIYVGNLVHAIEAVTTHPHAADRLFLVSDGEDVSTPELVRRVASALHVRPRLVAVPVPWLRLAGRLTGRGAAVDRLVGSLALDSSRIQRDLDWSAPYSMQQGLEETARAFQQTIANAP